MKQLSKGDIRMPQIAKTESKIILATLLLALSVGPQHAMADAVVGPKSFVFSELPTSGVIESGPLAIWSATGQPTAEKLVFKDLGNGFWKAELPTRNQPATLVITR